MACSLLYAVNHAGLSRACETIPEKVVSKPLNDCFSTRSRKRVIRYLFTYTLIAFSLWSFRHGLGTMLSLSVLIPLLSPDGSPVAATVKGRVGESDPKRKMLLIEVDSLSTARKSFSTRGWVRGHPSRREEGEFPSLEPGERIALSGKISLPRDYRVPGVFSWKRWFAEKKIDAVMHFDSSSLTRRSRSQGSAWAQGYDRVQRGIHFLHSKLSLIFFKSPYGYVYRALVLGDTSGFSKEFSEILIATGTIHIFVVSGWHFGLIGLFFLASARRFALLFPALQRINLAGCTALFSLMGVTLFLALCPTGVPTGRAFLASLLFFGCILAGRRVSFAFLLLVTAFLTAFYYPHSAEGASYQLTFSALIGIYIGHRVLAPVRWYSKLGVTTAAAYLATVPILAYHFHRISLVAPLANLLITPLISLLLFPFLAAGVATAPLEDLSHLLLRGADRVWEVMAFICRALSEVPYAHLQIFPPTLFELWLYYLAIGVLLYIYASKRPSISKSTSRSSVKFEYTASGEFFRLPLAKRVGKFLMIIVVLGIAFDLAYWYCKLHPRHLVFSFLDVGQGDSILIEFPGGKTMLVDGGTRGWQKESAFDLGKTVVLPYLRHKRRKSIDYLVLTHTDLDHLGGLLSVVQGVGVKEVWLAQWRDAKEHFYDWLRAVEEREIPIYLLHNRLRPERIGRASVEVIWPPLSLLVRKTTEPDHANDRSLVLKLTDGNRAALLTGDIGENVEDAILKEFHFVRGNLRADLLKVPHHGSGYSSSIDFLRAVEPKVAVCSVGLENRYGHPAPRAVARYRLAKIPLLMTESSGTVVVHLKEDSVIAKDFEGETIP
ncbi:MAG: DNA internalization-related competence protein ComEC/Rec2 [Deltaproteobacteria bacterium]|nr:DNA internalization-related competence protein ComEC/Rec2 [Deltaproteobacteria bacterium]